MTRGELIVTQKRLIGLIGKYKIIDVSKKDKLYSCLNFDRSNSKRFQIKIDLKNFNSGYTGTMKLSYHVDPNFVII